MDTKYEFGEVVELKIGKKTFEVTMYDTEPVYIKNPFSGAGCILDPVAVQVYDLAKGAEMTGKYDLLETTLSYFRKHWPAEYMTLLD